MQIAPIPAFEDDRIRAVNGLNILDSETEERFDVITKEAVRRFDVPISTIAVIDSKREWFKSVCGLPVREGRRDISFCGHAVLSPDIFIVEDTFNDVRFADNPMVVGVPFIRFYAGKSIYDRKSNMPVGVLCIKDIKPRKMIGKDISDFLELAEKAEAELNKGI